MFASGGTTVPSICWHVGWRAHEPCCPGAAARCGFGSAAHFAHRFKERYGLRPTDGLREARAGI
ncbi:hypothetical protein ACFC4G_46435 [Streptomyces sp. NPDC056002]|uniref:hypothetical protein n=1 Tax=Streptomyces sp. NPDC056002 TaxID=3345675 RepID=UPI0035E23BB7